MFALATLLGCGWFSRDPVEELAAQVIRGPVSALPASEIDALPDLPPLRPGELKPLAGGNPGGLRVLAVAPQGEGVEPSQVAVVFDRPMVPVGALEQPVPLTCTPAIDGRARWAGTSTAVLVPSADRFPGSTSFACTVPAGTAAADGTTTTEAITWTFETARLALRRSWPRSGADDVAPSEPIRLRFNEAVDPTALAAAISLTTDDGTTPIEVHRAGPPHDRPDTVEIRAALQAARHYALELPAGFVGAEGPLPTAEPSRVEFDTWSPPGLATFGPEGDAVDPESPIQLVFESPVPGEALSKHLRIVPTPPGDWLPSDGQPSRWWYLHPKLAARVQYTVSISPGWEDQHGQVCKESYSHSFTTGDFAPWFDAPSGAGSLYPAKQSLELPIRVRNVETAVVEVERLDVDALVRKPETWYDVGERTGGQAVTLRFPEAPNAYQSGLVDLAPFLPTGAGVVRLRTWSPQVKAWGERPLVYDAVLHVTDIGTHLQVGPDGAVAWLTRLSDGAPMAAATVEAWVKGVRTAMATSDARGIAELRGNVVPDDWKRWYREELLVVVRDGNDVALTSHRFDAGFEGWETGVYPSLDPLDTRVRLEGFSDRGVYRPGEIAHLQVLARTVNRQAFANPGRLPVRWALVGPGGESLREGQGALDADGAFPLDVQLPAEAELGDHRVDLVVGNDSTSIDLPVKHFRAPAFRVDVHARAPTRLPGESAEATVQARYLFGAPMKALPVAWSVRRVPLDLRVEGADGFSFAPLPPEDAWSYAPSEESVSQGTGTLGADGSFAIAQPLAAADITRPWLYSLEASVTDLDRQQVAGRARVDVLDASLHPGVRLQSWLGQAGKVEQVDVVAASAEGKLARGQAVEMQAVRRTWDAVRERGLDGNYHWVNTPKDEIVASGSVRTGATPARWNFTPGTGGEYVVRATTKDPAGRTAVAESSMYVLGGDPSWAKSDAKTLDLVPDRLRYSPGDTARVLVKAPRAGMRALVTVAREGIYESRALTLQTTAEAIPVELTRDMAPNVYVTVVLVAGGALPETWYGATELSVDPRDQRLDAKVTTDKPTYAPRDPVTATVTVTDPAGRGIPGAHVTLWAVDHGVLSLTAFEVPDLFSRFYTPRPLGLLLADNRVNVYDRAARLAKGAPTGGGGGGLDGVRTKFETTPLWAASRHADGRGVVAHRFTLPDNLTTFRLMAVADDGAGAFGSGQAELRVALPLLVREALPRFFRQGDRALGGVVVHNNTGGALNVQVDGKAEGATLQGAPRTVSIEAGSAREVPFALTEFAKASTRFEFHARAGELHDAMVKEVPVVQNRPTEVTATFASTTATATESVKIPPDAVLGVGGLDVELSPSVLVGMGKAVQSMVDYPHGCVEQVGSTLRVLLMARAHRERMGLQTPIPVLDDMIAVGLGKMRGFRVPGGGMSYWPGGTEASPVASAYALEVLAEAKAQGREVDEAWLDGLATRSRQVLDERWAPAWMSESARWAQAAQVAVSLARAGRGDAGLAAVVHDHRNALGMASRAQLAEAIARGTGTDRRVAELRRHIEAATKVEASTAQVRQGALPAGTWQSTELATAAFLRALQADATEHPLAERLAMHVVAARTNDAWSNTYTSAESLAALGAFADRREGGKVLGKVELGRQPFLQSDFPGGSPVAKHLAMPDVRPGNLVFTTNPGTRLYYAVRLAYALPSPPARDEGFTVARSLALVDGGGARGRLEPGATVRVTLRVVTPVDRFDVAVVDPLPAGLEPVDTSFATTASSLHDREPGDTGGGDTGSLDALPRTWSAWVFDRRELRDDRAVFYASYMPAGVHSIGYLARATTPGDYAHPAATAEEMYHPERYGRTEAGRMVVGARLARK